jgi:hypothetical protein
MKFKYMGIILLGIFLIGFSQINSFADKEVKFTDMGNGTIRDNDTGLIWLKETSCSDLAGTVLYGRGNWDIALEAAANLSYGTCGLTDGSSPGDWRLPTKTEWEAFMSPDYNNPALVNTEGDAQWSEGDAFKGVRSRFYWSSTEYSSSGAWGANMFYGRLSYRNKGDYGYVWPVRNGN